jgi:RNA polymerase sigma factor (sigma-70 family)
MAKSGYFTHVDLESALRALTPRLVGYCSGHLGSGSGGEDIAQEALTALVTTWRRSGPPASPDAFVFAIAKRRVNRALWRQRLLAPIEFALDHHHSEPDPERSTIAREQRGQLLAAMRRLPRADREALLLVTVGEHSIGDAARLLSTTNAALKMRVMRARRRLRVLMDEDHGR